MKHYISATVTNRDQHLETIEVPTTANHVFGCRGLIGRTILKASRVYQKNLTYGYSRNPNPEFYHPGELIRLDLTHEMNEEKIRRLINSETALNNLILSAWCGHPRSNQAESKENKAANAKIVFNYKKIIDWIRPDYVLFISTSGALCKSGQIFTERTKPNATSEYGIQKLAAEVEISRCCYDLGIPVGILRISSACGFTGAAKGLGVLNEWSNKAVRGSPISLLRPLESTVNLISEDLLEDAFSFCLENSLDGMYNISSSNSVSLEEIVRCLSSLGFDPRITREESSKSMIFETLIDNSKFKFASGLALEFDLKQEARSILSEALLTMRITS